MTSPQAMVVNLGDSKKSAFMGRNLKVMPTGCPLTPFFPSRIFRIGGLISVQLKLTILSHLGFRGNPRFSLLSYVSLALPMFEPCE